VRYRRCASIHGCVDSLQDAFAHTNDRTLVRDTGDFFTRESIRHRSIESISICIAARISNEFNKRYCVFETFYDFVTGYNRLCEASGGNDTGTMLGEQRGNLDTPNRSCSAKRISRGLRVQSFLSCYRFCARTPSAEVVGPVNHRPGKLEGLLALQATFDHIGSSGVHSLRR
jgi:hypothetical protein